ncbi:MAG TPA: MFS transporter [Vicinamibacterales bacterium]|nr:MFS transporter [Vicinamibacterales bacterium]
MNKTAAAAPTLWGMNGYQWMVIFAAWLGWGFDVFDGLLFNFVAPNCVPTLLGLPIGSPEARSATLEWTGRLTALLLIGWAVGGIVFGWIADRIGRTRTLMLTMLMYALGTALCAVAPNMWMLVVFRIIASLGIGGEWAAGAAMVAETVPEKRRLEAGALLYTSAPLGLLAANYVNKVIAGHWLLDSPETSWRWVFACGLIPAAVALLVRVWVKEPERWKNVHQRVAPARVSELFKRENLPLVRSGFFAAVTALLMWWSCNAFIPVVAANLAQAEGGLRGLDASATRSLIESWKSLATNYFNFGGLLGTLLTVPFAKYLGRRTMFGIYFAGSAAAILATFGLNLEPEVRLRMYFLIGLTVFGVFGSFTYYLPELFPTRLRGTGAGFCYNVGRIVAAAGPFIVGEAAARGAALVTLFYVGFIPAAGLLILPWIIETRGRALSD